MNRRTFLKLTASAVAITTVPAMAKKSVSAPQWIPFTERTPKVGDKVIIINSSYRDRHISGGTIIDRYTGRNSDDYVALPMSRDFSRRKHMANGNFVYALYSDEGAKVIKTRKWLGDHGKPSRVTDYIKYEEKYINSSNYMGACYSLIGHWWLPVDGEYPKTLPKMPKAIAVWHNPPKCYLPGGRSRWFDSLYSNTKA